MKKTQNTPQATRDGALLSRVRQEQWWSQQCLAFHLGICVSYLVDIEKGRRLPSAALSARIRAWMCERDGAAAERFMT